MESMKLMKSRESEDVRASSYSVSSHASNGHVKESHGKEDEKNKTMSGNVMKVVFISLLVDLFAFTMILPLLPLLMDYYQKNDTDGLYPYLLSKLKRFQESWNVPDHFNSVLFGGFIGSLFSLLQFFASPVAGALSDKYGRKPLLLASMVGEAVSYLLWAVSFDFTVFVCSRIAGGISKCNISISTAVIADATSPEQRGKGMALIGAAFSLGFIFGPISGVMFAQWAKTQENVRFVAPALVALVLVLLDIAYLAIYFRETLPKEKRINKLESSLAKAWDFINPFALFAFKPVEGISSNDMKSLRRIGFVYFIYLFLYSGLEFTLTFLTHLRFQYTSMQQGRMFLFIGIIMASVQGGYVRRIASFKMKKTAMQGLALIIPSFIIMGFATNHLVFYLGLALYSFASATVVPSVTTIVSTYGSSNQKGIVMGIFRSLGALARALGPIAASCVFWSCGATCCYLVGGALLFLPLVLFRRVDDIKKE